MMSCRLFTSCFASVSRLGTTLLSAVAISHAEVHVASPFGDHMVLQADAKLPVWGTATPGETVTIEFANQRKSIAANPQGRWRIDLEPVNASVQPRVLTIAGSSTTRPIRAKDVLVGEVWLCSGEGNMERQLGPRGDQKPIVNWEQEVATAQHPTIRQLYVSPRIASGPQATAEAAWTVCSPGTVKTFSAVAYFFARDLQQKLGVPIGIINCTYSDSSIEAWTSAEGLKPFAEFSDGPKETSQRSAGTGSRSNAMLNATTPSGLFNGTVSPIVPYAIRGVALYQGESNSEHATLYCQLFPALIADWRDHWQQGDFPFLFVQLPPCRELRPELREVQLLTWQHTPNTAMVVTLDCGDIEDLHPARKQPVGARLALAARSLAYHEPVEYSGPIYDSMTVNEDRAILHFTHRATGLAANDFSLMGFTMAGPDGVFHAAHGEIVGDTVEVSIPEVEKPVAVRYAWERAPDGNLVNDLGLPASPFRTDHE